MESRNKNNFENVIQSNDSKLFLSNFALNGINHNQKSIDSATEFLTDFLVNSAHLAGDVNLKLKCKGSKKSDEPNWKFRKKNRKKVLPKWHDATCESVKKQIRHSSLLLKAHPNNSYLRGCLQNELKKYKKLVKSKHKEYINQLFKNLDELHTSNPRGYMTLVKSLRDGTFDKKLQDDSSYVSPENWLQHFSNLLGPPVTQGPTDEYMTSYLLENLDLVTSELDNPMTRAKVIEEISNLPNNKSTSFDMVLNKILKAEN